MQLRKMMWVCIALSVVALMAACGSTTASPGCTKDSDCGTGNTCDAASGMCKTASPGCTKNSDCGTGQTCDTASGVCKTASPGCTKNSDCGTGQICDTASGACENARTGITCSADGDCLSTELCHPGARVCVQVCTTSVDCPSSAKTCGSISGSTEKRKVCQCATDALCAQDERVPGMTLACNVVYDVCAPAGPRACTKDIDCSADQTCDTASSVCKAPVCTDTSCPAGEVCNTSMGGCEPSTLGAVCSGASQSSCNYGEYCTSTCTAAPVAPSSCANFSNVHVAWSASTSNGPVIYSVTGTYATGYSYCPSEAPDAFLIKVNAYRTDADWPLSSSGVAGFFYLPVNATASSRIDIIQQKLLIPTTGYSVTTSNKRDAEFNLYLCRPSNSQTLQTGLYFTGGNPVCTQLNR